MKVMAWMTGIDTLPIYVLIQNAMTKVVILTKHVRSLPTTNFIEIYEPDNFKCILK